MRGTATSHPGRILCFIRVFRGLKIIINLLSLRSMVLSRGPISQRQHAWEEGKGGQSHQAKVGRRVSCMNRIAGGLDGACAKNILYLWWHVCWLPQNPESNPTFQHMSMLMYGYFTCRCALFSYVSFHMHPIWTSPHNITKVITGQPHDTRTSTLWSKTYLMILLPPLITASSQKNLKLGFVHIACMFI